MVLGGLEEGGRFLMGEVPLYEHMTGLGSVDTTHMCIGCEDQRSEFLNTSEFSTELPTHAGPGVESTGLLRS